MPFDVVRNNVINMRVDAIMNTAVPCLAIGLGTDSIVHEKTGSVWNRGNYEERRLIGGKE